MFYRNSGASSSTTPDDVQRLLIPDDPRVISNVSYWRKIIQGQRLAANCKLRVSLSSTFTRAQWGGRLRYVIPLLNVAEDTTVSLRCEGRQDKLRGNAG